MSEEARNIERQRTIWSAKLLTNDGELPVRVHDVSPTGARVRSERRLLEGQEVVLRHKDKFVCAHIAWSKTDEAGLEFFREQDEF